MFPGIIYYSLTGFGQVMQDCVRPAARKLFGNLEGIPAEEVSKELTEITPVLPVNGYEWCESAEWQAKFVRFLAD